MLTAPNLDYRNSFLEVCLVTCEDHKRLINDCFHSGLTADVVICVAAELVSRRLALLASAKQVAAVRREQL
jgi:hypothetical protein